MKIKVLKTNAGQQELLKALIQWGIELNDFNSLFELLSREDAKDFIKEYIEDVSDTIYKEEVATKLQQFFLTKINNSNLEDNFNKALYDKKANSFEYSKALPELSTTDKNQPDSINKLLCMQFDTAIVPSDVFIFPCAGRGSDALFVCNTYKVSKDNCFFIELNFRLCLRLISLGFKNVICGDIKSESTWLKLYNMLKENNMIPTKSLMNPPYDGATHLDILMVVREHIKALNPNCELVSIQPCDWLENPLTIYKSGKYKKFFNDTLLSLTNLQVIDAMTAQKAFSIGTDVDLGIYTYIPNKQNFNLDTIRTPIANRAFNKIMKKLETMRSLNDVLDENAVDGWRVKLNELRPQSGGTNPEANGYSHKTWGIQLISSTEAGINECVFKDGYNDDGIYWTNVRSKNQYGKNDGATFRHSIKTNDKLTALNIAESCNTDFYRNWIYLVKFNQHMPLGFLPYMEDYDKAWTNERFCKYFNLDEEETAFMCRQVKDYRVKDFINYSKLDEE